MAKEISHDSLENIIDDYSIIDKEKSSKKDKKKKKEKNNNVIKIITIISLVANITLGSILLYTYSNYKNDYYEYYSELEKVENERNDYKNKSDNLDLLLNGNQYDYVSNKLNFFDNNIVFVIGGYGDYYYNYDCMRNKVGDNNYTYWAYNKEAAINRGYSEGSCE